MTIPLFLATRTTPITVYRRGTSQYVGGRLVEGAEQTLPTIQANVQPVEKFSDTMQLAEADRTKRAIKVYSTFELLAEDEKYNIQADRVLYNNELWEVKKSITYTMGVLNHTKAICVRITNG